MFLWKIWQILIKGYNVEFSSDNRRGRTVVQKTVNWHSPASVRKARESSLGVKGAKLFNLLPKEIRNITSDKVDNFKTVLDKFLSKVPDEPTISESARAAETNSLLHQLPLMARV